MKVENLGNKLYTTKPKESNLLQDMSGILTQDGNFFFCKITEYKKLLNELEDLQIDLKDAIRFSSATNNIVNVECPSGEFSSVSQQRKDRIVLSENQVRALYNILFLIGLEMESSIANNRLANMGFLTHEDKKLKTQNLKTIKNTLGSNFSFSYLRDCLHQKF